MNSGFFLLAASVALLTQHANGQSAPVNLPAYRLAELRSDFNRASDRVRVLTLLSPTCGGCQHGHRVMQSVFRKFGGDSRLRGYVVWLPMLPTDDLNTASEIAGAFVDARVTQWWDGQRAAGSTLARTLKLKGAVWDVYLLYAPGVRWEGDAPPPPSFWMHQLREADQRTCLNPAVFVKEVEAALQRTR